MKKVPGASFANRFLLNRSFLRFHLVQGGTLNKVIRKLVVPLIFVVLLGLPSPALAQEQISSGVAILTEIADTSAKDGDIISYTKSGYVPTTIPYDPMIYGVLTDKPAVTLEDQADENSHYVLANGKAYVNVTTVNGPIKEGDLITSSKTKGAGQKATINGYVLGTAIEAYSDTDQKKIGKILVSLHPGFSSETVALRSNLLENFNVALATPFLSPVNAFRYTIAGLAGLLSLALGIWFFGRVASRGVEAIGRNPLAGRQIMVSIVFNVGLTFAIMALGIAVAYFILSL